MAIKLKCPSCRERLFAEESDRGGSIRCPGCETPVPVPTAAAPAAPPASLSGVVKAVPTIPVLKPLRPQDDGIVEAEIVTAKPVKAKSAAAIPTVAPVEPAPRKPKERTGFRLRGDGDEDDDRPRRRTADDDEDDDHETAAKGSSALLFVILGIGVLLLGGIGVGVYFLTAGGDTPEIVDNTDPTPNPNPNPNPGRNNPAAMPAGWDTVTGDRFTFHAPQANLKQEPLAAKGMTGQVWMSKELGSGVECAGAYLDRKAGDKPGSLLDITRDAFTVAGGKVAGNRAINGRSCTEFQFDGGKSSRVWAHVTQDRLFLFRFTGDLRNPAVGEKRDHFMANIKVTHPIGVVDPIDVGPGPGGPNPPPETPETPFEAVPTLAEDGFTVEMPGGSDVKGESQANVLTVDRKYRVRPKKFEAKDGPYTFQLTYYDLADEADYDAAQFLTPLLPFPWKAKLDEESPVGGHPGQRWTIRHGTFQGPAPAATVRVGFRVFTLLTTKGGIHKEPDPELDARAKKFIDSLKVSFDPATAPTEAKDPAWVEMPRTNGFTATAPRGTEIRDYRRGFRDTEVLGKQYTAEDDQVKCVVTMAQCGPQVDPATAMLDISGRDKIIDGPKKITHNGLTGEEFTQGGFSGEVRARVRTFVNGNAVAVLRVEAKGNQSDREVLLKTRAFFNSFKTGAGGGVVGGDGEFASPGKVVPFWTAVVLPTKKELVTLGARNPGDLSPGGVLRRYSYPDFKLKATYHLPQPVNLAVADEKAGKLICSAISRWQTMPPLDLRESVSWTSDLQIFDLNKLTDGMLIEGEEVKPASKLTVGQPISGLVADPTGGFAYVSVVVLPLGKGPVRPATGKLYKLDTAKDDWVGSPLAHAEPLDGLRIAPTGGTLVTCETVVGPPRPNKQLNLLTVDAITWRKSKLIPIPAPAKDLTFADDGILALAAVGNKTRMYGYTPGAAEAVDVTPADIPMDGFYYLRVTPNGKRAIAVAGPKQNGLVVMTVSRNGDKAKFEKVMSGGTVGETPVGGHFILTPDSKYAVFNCGAIVDLEKTAAAMKGKE